MYKVVTVAATVVLAAVIGLTAQISSGEVSRLTEAAQTVRDIHTDIPQDYWNRARCIAVIPNLKKAAFMFGGEYGKGVMSCRVGEGWSAPVFMQLAKGSWGFQIGAEEVDVVLLMMNESGVQKLLQNKVTLGADASIAAGPLGHQGHVGTDAGLTAEILSYSRAKGLFAGIDLSGGVLRPDEDANANAYGRGITPKAILAGTGASMPAEARVFLNALDTAAPLATTGSRP